MEDLKTNGNSLNRQNQEMTLTSENNFWFMQGDFICRHHIELSVSLYVPKEETFRLPPKYIDVMTSTNTDLDVAQ